MKHLFFVLFVLVIYSCSKEEQTETIDKEEIGQEIAKLVYFEKFTEAELVNYLEEKNIEFSREIADISSGYLKVFSKEKIEEITLSFKSRKTELETRNTPCFDDWVEDM